MPSRGHCRDLGRAVLVAETMLNWHYDGKLARFKVCTMRSLVAVWERNRRISSVSPSFCKVYYHGLLFIYWGVQQFQRV